MEAGDALGFEVLSRAELESVRGEAIPAVLYYAVLYAPSLTALLSSSIANHFPIMVIRHAWNEVRR